MAGRHDLHAQLWSEAFSALARPAGAAAAPEFGSSSMRINQHITVCVLGERPQVQAPDGSRTTVLVDPATGIDTCAGYWPGEAGWHQRQQGDESWPFHVSDSEEAAGVRSTELQDATLQLAQQSVPSNRTLPTAAPARRGSPWPWFFAWLLAAAALWWLERTRAGRALSQGSNS